MSMEQDIIYSLENAADIALKSVNDQASLEERMALYRYLKALAELSTQIPLQAD